MDSQKSFTIDKRRRPVGVIASTLVTLTFLLGACGGDNGGEANPTATTASQTQNATPTAIATASSGSVSGSGSITESEQTTETTSGTGSVAATPEEVTVITSTNLITGTQVTTDVNVTTDTAVIEQQNITTVVTSTDVISNVNETSDTSTSSETAIITATAEVSPSTTVATPQATQTPRTVQTPQAGQTPQAQGATTGAVANGAGVVDIGNRSILASTLLDTGFHTSDGQVTGEVQDAVIDLQTGQILYLLLEYGGVLDVGDVDLPAPLKAFTWGDDDQLVLNVEGDRISNFEGVGNDWPTTQDGTWDTDIRNFWTEAGFDVDFDAAQTGTQFARVSNITGNALGDAGFDNANVEDLIIDLGQGRANYVLLSSAAADAANGTGNITNTTNTAVNAGDGWLIVPFGAFTRMDNGLGVNPQFDAGLLEQAPRFNAPDFGDIRLFDENFDQEWRSFWGNAGFPVGTQGG